MKHKKPNDNRPTNGPQLVPVRFEFDHPTAVTVCVAGTFNQWHATSKSMDNSGYGHWLQEMALAPGVYEYCIVVDGQWRPDPLAIESVPNPFGGRNSILKVTTSPEAAHRAKARDLPMKKTNT